MSTTKSSLSDRVENSEVLRRSKLDYGSLIWLPIWFPFCEKYVRAVEYGENVCVYPERGIDNNLAVAEF